MTKRDKDQSKRIAPIEVLGAAQRWLDTAAALLPDHAHVAQARCINVAAQLRDVIEHGGKPDMPVDHSAQFDLFDAAQDAYAAGKGIVVTGQHTSGVIYLPHMDYFLCTVKGKVDVGYCGDLLEERLNHTRQMLEALHIKSKSVDDVYRAVWGARQDERFRAELEGMTQEVK
jgi:hypothetical protein